MTANPRPPRETDGAAAPLPRTWARTTLLPIGIAVVTLAMIVALGLPVNAASHDAWPLSGKRVTTGSAKDSTSAKNVGRQIAAGRIADAVPNPSGATRGTTVAASIPSSTTASSTTKGAAASPTTTRSVVAAPTAPAPTAAPTTVPPAPPPTIAAPPPAAGAI